MGRRDLLSNTIYQRMKQLQSRLRKRNQEEERRQAEAERAKTARWEAHQKQFEEYLKRCAQAPKRRRRPPARTSVPPNTVAGYTSSCSEEGIILEQVHLVEALENRSYSSSSQSSRSKALSLPQPGMVRKREDKKMGQGWYGADWPSSPSSQSPNRLSTGKSDLARGLEEFDDGSEDEEEELHTPKSTMSNNYSTALSLPPTLPSTPTESGSILVQTPIPPHETPVIPLLADHPQFSEEEPALPDLAITKMATATSEEEPPKPAKTPKKPKIKKKGKKKGSRKGAQLKNQPESSSDLELLKEESKEKPMGRNEAQNKIKEIFTSVNTLPEEELTEEAFDVFLDTIKKLSEYVDMDEIDSQNYEVVDDISSGFSSRANEYLADDSSGATIPAHKMFAGLSSFPSPTDIHEDPSGKAILSAVQLKRMKADEKRKQRILVVREKQAGIIMYRKVTMAELRLRRQRALMRVRSRLLNESMERDKVHLQRVRLLELAHLNEKERQARLEQFKLEEERRMLDEAEIKRMKELRVKEELEHLLERSRRRQAEEQRLARLARERREREERRTGEEPPAPEEKEESIDSDGERRQRLQASWRTIARRARNKERFERMVQQNSQVLYRALVKELITQRQKDFLTDIPGFSYFLLLKYTLDLDDITDIMSDLG